MTRKISHFLSISICLYAYGNRDLYVCFLAGLPDFIMIYCRFLYVFVDIESKFDIFYHFDQKLLVKKANRNKLS